MPIYVFRDIETNEVFERFMSLTDKELYLNQNPKIQQVITSVNIVSGISIKDKVPDGFKEVLSKVAENHTTSTVAERHGKKSIKQIKTEQIMRKHREKV